jgi:hypothetical protein
MITLDIPLLRASASGPWSEPWDLGNALADCLRERLGLPSAPGTWAPTPGQQVQEDRGAVDVTLSLAPGASVRRAMSVEMAWDPGQYHQEYRLWLEGFPGARLDIRGDTLEVWAWAHVRAESAEAALALWEALSGTLPRRGWHEVALAVSASAQQVRGLAEAAGLARAWEGLGERAARDFAAFAQRGIERTGRLGLQEYAPGPLTGEALALLLRAAPTGKVIRHLVLPGGLNPAPVGAGPALAALERLDGAFQRTPSPVELPQLAHAEWSLDLPGDVATYPWDELARLERLVMATLEHPTPLPRSVLLSPSLRELTVRRSVDLALPATSAGGPLRLRQLTLALGGRALLLEDGELPSAHTLEVLELTFLTLPGGLRGPLPRLRQLQLWNNQLAQLPDGLSGCAQLEELRVYGNPLTSLSGLPPLPKLRALSLRDAQLATWPAELETLPVLEELDLSRTSLPLSRDEVMARLPRLKVLHLPTR